MIYTIGQIRKILAPIAQEYHVPAVYLFGSYARGDAGEASDLDFLVDTAGTGLTSLMKLGALQVDLEAAFEKPVDLLPVSSLEQAPQKPSDVSFRRAVLRERVCVYDPLITAKNAPAGRGRRKKPLPRGGGSGNHFGKGK